MKLSAEEHARIEAAAKDADARTGARFSAVIVPVSERYALFPAVWGAAFGFTVGVAAALLWPLMLLRTGMAVAVGAAALFALVSDWLPLRLLLVPAHVKRQHASAMAHRAFAAHILASRQDGILFFVSLGERHVEVLASKDVHARVGEDAWRRIVAGFVSAAKAGRVTDGAVGAIEACAQHLAAHFPK